jgi:hypothetical protein
VARIELTLQQAATGTWTVRWSSARHPPQIVLRADGTTQVITAENENDLLGGFAPNRVRTDHTWSAQPESPFCSTPTG